LQVDFNLAQEYSQPQSENPILKNPIFDQKTPISSMKMT
jgi:hypothetical protein